MVRGLGAVYVDTNLQNEGFTFLGVAFDEPIVARVRIEYGTTALGPTQSVAGTCR